MPLGLVNVYGAQPPWHNHQVLAIGYRNRANGPASIAVYDPNYPVSDHNPDGITYLHTWGTKRQTRDPENTDPIHRVDDEGTVVGTVRHRGFFRSPYNSRTPYWTEEEEEEEEEQEGPRRELF